MPDAGRRDNAHLPILPTCPSCPPAHLKVELSCPPNHARDTARTRLKHNNLVVRRYEVAVEAAGLEPTDRDIPHRVSEKPLRDHASAADAHAAALPIARSRNEQGPDRDAI